MFDWLIRHTMQNGAIKWFYFANLRHNQFVFCFLKWKQCIEKHMIANFTRYTFIYKHNLHDNTS